MPVFRYHPDLLAAFPDLCGGVLLAQDLHNGPAAPALQAAFLAEQQAALARWGAVSPADIPSLSAWRAVFRRFGVEPTKYRSAAEALLRRLTKKGDIPSINQLVDVYNLVSIRYALPMAAFDLRRLSGNLTVRFADGSERFTAHDTPEPEHPEPGEVIFVDDSGLIYARRWCWKQSLESTADESTPTALITIEAHHAKARADVQAAAQDLMALLTSYLGGRYTLALLGPENPVFQF